MPPRPLMSSIDKIHKRSKKNELTGCIEFQMYPNANPDSKRALYIKTRDKTESVLRVVWRHEHPDQFLSAAAQIRRKCKNRLCVNPDHLYIIGDPDFTNPQMSFKF